MGDEACIVMTDYELLERVLSLRYEGKLSAREQEAFTEMSERMTPDGNGLSVKQRRWARGVAERLGIRVPIAKNLFSTMSDAERKAQLGQVKTLLPWEKPGYKKVLRPPTREPG